MWIHGNRISTLDEKANLEHRLLPRNETTHHLINFNPALKFTSPEEQFDIPYPIDQMYKFTFIAVYQALVDTMEMGIWSTKDSDRNILLTTHRIGGPKDVLPYEGGADGIPTINTMVQQWGNPNTASFGQSLHFGGIANKQGEVASLQGYIPEFMVFDRRLSRSERTIMETYLAIKYGVTLHKSDYVNSARKVIWDEESNRSFSNRIAGIGRDDTVSLYQKQSHSTAEQNFLTIGLGSIEVSNAANQGQLKQHQFLLWGDDNKAFLEEPFEGEERPKLSLFQRRWLMQPFGFEEDHVITEVRVNFSQIEIPENYDPVLLIDRAGSDAWSMKESEIIKASMLTEEGMVHFKGVSWDKDQSGKDLFRFGLLRREIRLTKSFSVNPNPAKGNFNIQVQLEQVGDVSINIYDLSGKLVKSLVGNGQLEYQFEDQLQGIGEYIVQLKTADETQSKALIIVK